MPLESSRRPKMAKPVASTAPATLLKVRSLIVLFPCPLTAGIAASESAGIPPLIAPGSLTRYRRSRNRPSDTMNPIVLIPARMAATRLPGKPLADIEGVPMIVRVLRQAEAAGAGPVAVAAGDAEIVAAVRAAGGRAVLTDPALPSGSDRILAALAELDPQGRHDLVVNLQGDMPFVEP